MIVFGDSARVVAAAEFLAQIVDAAERREPSNLWIESHAETVRSFIDIAELTQGVVDAEFEGAGIDRPSPLATAATDLLMVAARRLERSWDGRPLGDARSLIEAAERIVACGLPQRVVRRRAEGYAFYALYPETYLEAGRALRNTGPIRFIGVRSIGFGLAALAAVGAGAEPPLSVRPVGHPFRRVLMLSTATKRKLSNQDCAYAAVDEGPGLSGSSLGAVFAALETAGVARRSLRVLPSHCGDPGPQASAADRARWPHLQKHLVTFESQFVDHCDGQRTLPGWIVDLVGAPTQPVRDIGAGAWRALHYDCETRWPAAHVQQERRKYVLRTARGDWLLKFNGLDRMSQRKATWAKALAEAGFTPQFKAIRHGFLVEPWLSDASPLHPRAVPRAILVAKLGAYLGFRARHFLADESGGATLTLLADVLVQNAATALGETVTSDLSRFCRRMIDSALIVRRVATDNRLHAWEWLRRSDGAILKSDAVDHAMTHDIIGAQDIAWDIAGAIVEWDLDADEAKEAQRQTEWRAGRAIDPRLIAFLLPCYTAFQYGAACLAQQSLQLFPAEAERFAESSSRYRMLLKSQLSRLL